jgi:hypothetical protein
LAPAMIPQRNKRRTSLGADQQQVCRVLLGLFWLCIRPLLTLMCTMGQATRADFYG